MNVKELKSKGIFYFFSCILLRIINGHYLINGNKRTGLSFIVVLMYEFGFYLKWSKNNDDIYNKEYEDFLVKCIKKANKEGENSAITYAQKYLKKHAVIALNFR